MDTNLATKTLADLTNAVLAAPEAVSELLREYGCEVPASAEALILLASIKGEAFVDDLYILLNQVPGNKATAARYAGIDGVIEQSSPVAPSSLTRTSLGAGLQVLLDMLSNKVGTSGTAGGVGYDANAVAHPEDPTPKILGLSQPVFYAGCVVLALAVVVLLIHYNK
jgi:hypothetical protein